MRFMDSPQKMAHRALTASHPGRHFRMSYEILDQIVIRFLAFPDLGKTSPVKAVANSERMLNA
jgi:hypothetical protein